MLSAVLPHCKWWPDGGVLWRAAKAPLTVCNQTFSATTLTGSPIYHYFKRWKLVSYSARKAQPISQNSNTTQRLHIRNCRGGRWNVENVISWSPNNFIVPTDAHWYKIV